MESTDNAVGVTIRGESRQPVLLAVLFGLLVFLRGAFLLWAFSFGFYRDSNLYVSLGHTLFTRGGPFSTGVVTFPYPFINALTRSWIDPYALVWTQIAIAALAAGFLVFVIAKSNPLLATVIGVMLVTDLVWGAISRNLMTEGLFVSFNLLSLAFMVRHYRERKTVSALELFLVGLIYGWTFIFRPSSLFLTFLIIPLYLWFTRSVRKTAIVTSGMLILYLVLGAFNLWSSGEFRLMGQSGYYTGSPLFVYRLFTPENGSSSRQLGDYLSSCLPGVDYANLMDTTAGGTKNNEILYGQFIPCLRNHGLSLDQASDLMTKAYVEGIKSRPLYYGGVLLREGTIFLKYNVPYILRFYLKPELNNQCNTYSWCTDIRQSRFSWGANLPLARLYERAATKLFQIHLVLLPLLNPFFSKDSLLPFLIAWLVLISFLLLATRGEVRFLVVTCLLLIHYLIFSVISGYGFLERYASILTPFYIILSAVALVTLGTMVWKTLPRLLQPKPRSTR